MATEQFANNAQSNLTAALTAGATSLTVQSAAAFPAAGNFRVLIDGEILLVTAVAGNTFTVTRGAEGTTATAHAPGAYVTHVLTAAALLNCPRSMTTTGDVEYLAASGAVTRRAIGSAGQVLTVVGGLPAWQNAAGSADMLAALVNSPNLITNADANLSSATWNVVKATTAAHTVTLPAPAAGALVGVRIDPASTKLVTVSRHAAELIDGQATRVMWAGEKAVLLSDGADWFKVAGLTVPMQCQMALSADQTVNNNTETKVTFDTAVIDNTGLMADAANKRVNFVRGSAYLTIVAVRWDTLSAGASRAAGYSYKNGNTLGLSPALYEISCQSGGDPVTPALGHGSYAAGDYVEGYAYQNSGASQNVLGTGNTRGAWMSFIEIPSW
jgi:hypothetical protein